jgi:hypothetical protein
VGDWKDSRKARLIMSCRHSARGLQFPGFWNGRSPPNSISRAVESANRRQQKQQDITLCTDRRLLEASVQTLQHAGRHELSHPLGKLSTGERTQCNGITLPSSLAGSHVSSGNECRQPRGRQSRASKTAGARAVFVRSV